MTVKPANGWGQRVEIDAGGCGCNSDELDPDVCAAGGDDVGAAEPADSWGQGVDAAGSNSDELDPDVCAAGGADSVGVAEPANGWGQGVKVSMLVAATLTNWTPMSALLVVAMVSVLPNLPTTGEEAPKASVFFP